MPRFLRLITHTYAVAFLWFGLSLFAVLKQVGRHNYNNYLIYKYTFINLLSRTNLYLPQPQHFSDSNHYGPVFAILIAPFTLFPDSLGAIIWTMANALVLFYAIRQLPLTLLQQNIVLLLCAHELMTSSYNVQFNPIMTALIMMSFVWMRNRQEFWAAFAIVLGTYVKLYGIVGLAFFFFAQRRLQFTGYVLLWGLVLFLLPMLFSSPAYIIQTYIDWYSSLREKNLTNTLSYMQDISVMGMIRRIFNYPQLSNMLVIGIGLVAFSLSYIKIQEYRKLTFQLLILASTLIFTVIFSTGSESPTYIIAFAGVAIWFVNLPRPVENTDIVLLIIALVLTSFSPSDLFPKFINRTYVKPYALKALPCLLIWLRIIQQSLTQKFENHVLNPVSA
ncbi:glycosyltransferase family 87 protein [Mucilaginibacter sp.]